MRLAYQIKVKNGALWQAAQSVGGISALSDHLGIPYPALISLINLRRPASFRSPQRTRYDWKDIEEKLCQLTGLTLDDIFPKKLSTSEFLASPHTHTVITELPVERLSSVHNRLALPSYQEQVERESEHQHLSNLTNAALDTLTPREEKVLKMRFGLPHKCDGVDCDDEHTLGSIGEQVGDVTRERIRQIQAKALRKMRHPSRSRSLKPFLASWRPPTVGDV
ncbi:MAG: hypothetical protein H0V18_07810 [Pyrinomonadaceae bacterium]|nr:hypothetical protein [Pyrinomonadaceae bacterium]